MFFGLPVPENEQQWEFEARQNNVPTNQFFSDCSALPSGSKFTMEHYLPLRILVVDERSMSKKKRRKLRGRYIPTDIRRKVLTTMEQDKSLQAVQKSLTKSSQIETQWSARQYRSVGPFGNGLEKLYQIVSRKFSSDPGPEIDEDNTNSKIFASSLSPPPISSLNAAFQSMNINRNPITPPPRAHLTRNHEIVDYRDLDEDSQLPETPGTQMSSAPGTAKRLALQDFERTTLVLSDEQTVNTCIENLLMALSNVMGFYGRLLSDRRAFVVPKTSNSNLYQACVDGLIMTPNRQDIMAFIEVKRRLRSTNDSVYRQIGAQMAAFIRNHDHQPDTHSSREQRCRWMISMEGYQAFIIMAFFDQAYVDYLCSKPGSDRYRGFLTMVTSRPYDLRVWNGKMKDFFADVATLMGGPKEN